LGYKTVADWLGENLDRYIDIIVKINHKINATTIITTSTPDESAR
jgi:polyphosphate kinase